MKNFCSRIRSLYSANRQIILYLFFGVCTTAINTVCYWLLYDIWMLHNIVSTVAAWFSAVIFAFVTNKVFVFESRRTKTSERISEVISFFGCRVLTGILDIAIMAIAVDMLHWNGLLWKLLSNVIVTIINYIASKFLIFRDTKEQT